MSGRLLVIDDDVDTCELMAANLRMSGYHVETRPSAEEGLEVIERSPFDVLLTDVHMPGMSGIGLCEKVSERHPQTRVVVMTGKATMELAVEALRAGAHDFVTKPVDLTQLLHRIGKAIHESELEGEVRRLQRVLDSAADSTMIGESETLRRVAGLVSRVASSDVPVLVTGESGVGKELVARELHRQSAQAEGPFIAVNCAAMPSELLESELFGHVRGAFTDAKRSRDGLFLRATGGTLFLDEIGELPIDMQPKLLRALQERKVRPVGGDKVMGFDARIVTATNRDLEAEAEAGRFREDLFYRINVINIHVPPLRSRGRDVLLLAHYFLSKIVERTGRPMRGFDTNAAAKMLTYDWPGNVRELENCIERAVALAQTDEICLSDLPDKIARYERGEMVIGSDDPEELPTLEALEARYIRRVLKAVKGNKSQAAQVLGLARRTLYRRLERLEPSASGGSGDSPTPSTP